MPIYNLGQLNTAALTAPDVYIQKIPPQTRYINGVPTDILGLVGVGSWGPVNSPVLAAGDTFGLVTFRKYDLATALLISSQVGANNVRAVRVSDGTDVAASVALVDTAGTPVTGCTLTAYYTGIVGNTLSAILAPVRRQTRRNSRSTARIMLPRCMTTSPARALPSGRRLSLPSITASRGSGAHRSFAWRRRPVRPGRRICRATRSRAARMA